MMSVRMALSVALLVWAALAGVAQADVSSVTAAGQSASTVNVQLNNLPVKQAVDTLFQGRGLKYYIQPGVSGKITELKIKGVTFDQALNALTEAAGLTYTIEDGAYIIGPAKNKSQQATAKPTETQPSTNTQQAAGPEQQIPASQAQPPMPVSPPASYGPQVVINQPPSPVYYGQPQVPGYGYGYPSVYRFGNIGIVGSGWGAPVAVTGGNPYIIGFFHRPPPPPGWVSPEVQRFLQFEWVARGYPGFITQY